MNTDLISYYRQRASEYEKIYQKPERQSDLLRAADLLQELLSGTSLLEIACGTGYWTERLAPVCKNIHATDINEAVLEIARSKEYGLTPVCFETVDFFDSQLDGNYDAVFGGFILSHITYETLSAFFRRLEELVPSGGTIVLIDNLYVEGNSHPIVKTDEGGNTYQQRQLRDGSVHLVLKNFHAEEVLIDVLQGKANEIRAIELEYFRILHYKKK